MPQLPELTVVSDKFNYVRMPYILAKHNTSISFHTHIQKLASTFPKLSGFVPKALTAAVADAAPPSPSVTQGFPVFHIAGTVSQGHELTKTKVPSRPWRFFCSFVKAKNEKARTVRRHSGARWRSSGGQNCRRTIGALNPRISVTQNSSMNQPC